MLAALVHDALYQLMREYHCNNLGATTIGGIYRNVFRLAADTLFRIHYKNNGGWRWGNNNLLYVKDIGEMLYIMRWRFQQKEMETTRPTKTAPALGLTSCPDSDEPASSS